MFSLLHVKLYHFVFKWFGRVAGCRESIVLDNIRNPGKYQNLETPDAGLPRAFLQQCKLLPKGVPIIPNYPRTFRFHGRERTPILLLYRGPISKIASSNYTHRFCACPMQYDTVLVALVHLLDKPS